MKLILRNVIAVLIGFAVGSAVNMGLIMISGSIIPPPAGADVTTMEGLKASLHLFEPKHFLFPFLAHSLGTFAGALCASFIVLNRRMEFALGVGILFLLGGMANVFMLPSPAWFTALDLICAYIPMGYLAGKLALKKIN